MRVGFSGTVVAKHLILPIFLCGEQNVEYLHLRKIKMLTYYEDFKITVITEMQINLQTEE